MALQRSTVVVMTEGARRISEHRHCPGVMPWDMQAACLTKQFDFARSVLGGGLTA